MEIICTPDQSAAVRQELAQRGITDYQRFRYDLNAPHKGWVPVATAGAHGADTRAQIASEAGLINRILKEHRIDAAVDRNAILDPGSCFVVYGIKLGPGVRIASIEQRMRELAEAISQSRQSATPVRLRTMPVGIEAPHPNQTPLTFDAGAKLPPHTAAMGKSFDYRGERAETIDLASTAHVLIAGTTGSGKSTLLAAMLLSLCANTSPADLRLILVDLKNEDLVPFSRLPHVQVFASDPDRAEHALQYVHGEKNRRVEGGRQRYQRLVLVVDELAELTHLAGGQSELGSVLAIGRSKAINVVAATQKPTAAVVGSVAKANFTSRFVGRVLSADDSRVASGQPRTGAELLPGNGSFLRIDGAEARRFQGYYVSHADIDRYIDQICARWHKQTSLL